MDYKGIDSFNKEFNNKKTQELLSRLPLKVSRLVKEALECEKDGDFDEIERIFREILDSDAPIVNEDVQALFFMIYGKMLQMDLEGIADCFRQDIEGYQGFLEKLEMNDDVKGNIVENLINLNGSMTNSWARPMYKEVLDCTAKYLTGEAYEGMLRSAYASMESYSYYADKRVSTVMQNVLKAAYDKAYTMNEDELVDTNRETMMIDSLISEWMFCEYSKENADEIEYIRETYPHTYELIAELDKAAAEDCEKKADEVLEQLIALAAPGTTKEQLKAVVMDMYEQQRRQNARPKVVYSGDDTYRRANPKIGRNDPCPCGSGKKYKQCCGKL